MSTIQIIGSYSVLFTLFCRTFNKGCEAELYVSVDRKEDKLVILRHIKEHNHQTDEMIFKQYPEQRRLTEKERETAETMLNMGVKVKLLQDYFQKSGKIVFFWVQIYKSNHWICLLHIIISHENCGIFSSPMGS